jgi:predicted HicB family RNase H-like nuclease
VKRDYLSRWPKVNLHVRPDIHEALTREAEYRMLSVSDVVREALASKYTTATKERR